MSQEINHSKQVINEALDMAIRKGNFGLLEVTNIVNSIQLLELDKKTENKPKDE